jgi:hypothetical protein
MALLARVGRDHEDDFAVVVDFVEEPEPADPIPPGFRLIPFELLDVPAEKGCARSWG